MLHRLAHCLPFGSGRILGDNLSEGHRKALPDLQVIFVEGGIGDQEVLQKLFAEHEPELMIHFAARAYVGESVENPLKYIIVATSASPW